MTEAFFEEVGEGTLYLSGDGQGTECLHNCPVAQRNKPGRKFGHDTANLYLLEGTQFFQWSGRKSDGCFWPHGKILRLTDAGIKHLKKQLTPNPVDPDAMWTDDVSVEDRLTVLKNRMIESILKQVKRHRTR